MKHAIDLYLVRPKNQVGEFIRTVPFEGELPAAQAHAEIEARAAQRDRRSLVKDSKTDRIFAVVRPVPAS